SSTDGKASDTAQLAGEIIIAIREQFNGKPFKASDGELFCQCQLSYSLRTPKSSGWLSCNGPLKVKYRLGDRAKNGLVAAAVFWPTAVWTGYHSIRLTRFDGIMDVYR